MVKSCEGKSRLRYPVREPRLVERGTEKDPEHGPGAGMAIGSHSRVRPLKRYEVKYVSLRAPKGRGNLPEEPGALENRHTGARTGSR